MESLLDLSFSQMASKIRSGEISPVELVKASLEAVASIDPKINSFCLVLAEEALQSAGELEAEAVAGKFRGPFHGVPIGVKDLFLTKGIATASGSRVFDGRIPNENAPIVERCLSAGAVMIGKNTTPEFGWKASSGSPLYGITRNPWDPTKTSGGSSSGSAAAVAARLVPASLGSDGGGSLRIPASFCGVFSLKPTLGRIPAYPWSPTEHFSHVGVITRTVEDTALMLDTLQGPDPRSHFCLPEESGSYVDNLQASKRKLRCAYVPNLFKTKVDDEISVALQKAVEDLSHIEGVEIEETELGLEDPLTIFETFWVAGRGLMYGAAVKGKEAELDPGFVRLIEGAKEYSLSDYLNASKQRADYIHRINQFFTKYDILLTPTVPILPFSAEEEGPEWMDRTRVMSWPQWTPFTYPFNITGQPAASIPCGRSADQLPIGLQVVGRHFEDAVVLRLCAALETRRPWHSWRPPVIDEK